MNQAAESLRQEPNPQDASAVLQRIVTAVEKDQQSHWAEMACAFVLSLATVSTAWCAYQATLWSGVQTFRLAAANKADRLSSTLHLQALQLRAHDAAMGVNWMQAKHQGNDRQEKFLFDRFRPEMKKAVVAWLKTDPFDNPKAPLGPMVMAEYVQAEAIEAKSLEEATAQEFAAARRANQTSDAYVLFTVLFASVLFFGGIAGTIDSRRVRMAIAAVALTLFVILLGSMVTMPTCRE